MTNHNDTWGGKALRIPAPDSTLEPLATFYAMRNQNGEYYKTHTSTRRSGWVPKLKNAKIWTTEGQAKGKITAYCNQYPEEPIPELVEFIVTEVRVINQRARVTQAQDEKARKEAQHRVRVRTTELRDAEHELARAKSRLEQLRRQ